jgi:hypothetical protein
MDRRLVILMIILMVLAFAGGFRKSFVTGIQPGYFEKAEAPAYGVGGGEVIGEGMSEEFQKHLKELYQETEE